MTDKELIADAIAAENVRLLLTGKIAEPLPGTLAFCVRTALAGSFALGFSMGGDA